MQGNVCTTCTGRTNKDLSVVNDILHVSLALRVNNNQKYLGALLRPCWCDFITGENSVWHKEVKRATMGEGRTGSSFYRMCHTEWVIFTQAHLLSLDQPWINILFSIFLHYIHWCETSCFQLFPLPLSPLNPLELFLTQHSIEKKKRYRRKKRKLYFHSTNNVSLESLTDNFVNREWKGQRAHSYFVTGVILCFFYNALFVEKSLFWMPVLLFVCLCQCFFYLGLFNLNYLCSEKQGR